MSQMKAVLGFDFGLKRIGVAVGNTLIRQAQPLTVISAATNEEKFAAIAELINEWRPDLCIVGLPRQTDGDKKEKTERCRRIAKKQHGSIGKDKAKEEERF